MTETLSQLSDEQILLALESIGSLDEDKTTIGFQIAETFFIFVRAGDSLSSTPLDKLEHLADYVSFSIELYYYREPPPIEETRMDPIEFTATKPDGTEVTYRFEFDVQVFPHILINPKEAEPFKSQPWAAKFVRGSFVNYVGRFDPHTICDIIRYCDKISRLKMFW